MLQPQHNNFSHSAILIINMNEVTLDQDPLGHEIKPPSPDKHKITRRRFLKVFAAFAGSVVAAGLLPSGAHAQQEYPSDLSDVTVTVLNPKEEETEETLKEVRQRTFDDITVYFDIEDIPVRFVIENSFESKEYELTQVERHNLRVQKERAINTARPEVGCQWLAKTKNLHIQGLSEERLVEAQDEYLSWDELNAAGIQIINCGKEEGTPQIRFRRSMLTGILEPLVVSNNYDPQNQSRLEIVAFPGPTIAAVHLPEGDVYDIHRFKTLFTNDTYNVYSSKRAKELDAAVAEVEAKLADPNLSGQDRKFNIAHLLHQKIERDLYLFTLPLREKIDEALRIEDGALGTFYTGYLESDSSHRGATSYIHVANPSAEQLAPKRVISFCFSPEGEFAVESTHYYPPGYRPGAADIERSYPTPEDFAAREPESNYLYEPDGIGFIIIHELAHFITIDVLPQMIKDELLDKSQFYQTWIASDPDIRPKFDQLVAQLADTTVPSDELSKTQEELADMIAMAYIKRASEQYAVNRDDSLYGIAIEVPESEYTPGGWQITGSQQNATT